MMNVTKSVTKIVHSSLLWLIHDHRSFSIVSSCSLRCSLRDKDQVTFLLIGMKHTPSVRKPHGSHASNPVSFLEQHQHVWVATFQFAGALVSKLYNLVRFSVLCGDHIPDLWIGSDREVILLPVLVHNHLRHLMHVVLLEDVSLSL